MSEMANDGWKRRWREGNIGFHQDDVNAELTRFWPQLVPDESAVVLVPLCGKSTDMIWLVRRGHRVVGVELSELAARAFFEDNGLRCSERTVGQFLVLESDGIEIWVGDFFALKPDMLPSLTAWYDRAAIVALEPAMRPAYAEQVDRLLQHDADGFMLTFDYPVNERKGPPFSVSFTDVEAAFGHAFTIRQLDCLDLTEGNRWELSRVLKQVVSLRR